MGRGGVHHRRRRPAHRGGHVARLRQGLRERPRRQRRGRRRLPAERGRAAHHAGGGAARRLRRRDEPRPGADVDRARRRPVPARAARALPQRDPDRLRRRRRRGGPVLLPGRPNLHRPLVLRRAVAPVRRPRRLRPGLRDRPRGRPPRPEPARASTTRSRGPAAPRRAQANELSVRLELQADCFAGVWGQLHEQRGNPRRGDLEEGLAPPPPSATTASPAAGSTPRPGPTARRSSARSGSSRGSSAAGRRTATPRATSRRWSERSTRTRSRPGRGRARW